ncbi:sensor domain-containing diguanylate cyclase [Sulfurimonas microaerophilic]|uniref:sensor domain-containing diguanylate cyclase n=1 Tax=Sulfurimonas microaerophilic TaxID=3058392 RepID=UPI002714D0E6|nr:sensor domain-containing diguanylate cyclase [Sulfurimonas sp. hsl 1-7]
MNFFKNTKNPYILFFKILGSILTISLFIYSIFLYNSYLSIVRETDNLLDTVLKQKSKNITAMLAHIEMDLDYMVEYAENKIKNDDPQFTKKVETNFFLFAKNHQHYQQVRYLDLEGKELVRVDRINNQVVRKKDLQDKSSRYYYIEATKLQKDEIYVSPLDLNIEYGQVEVPYRPMIRFAEPVFVNGMKKGYIVVNYCAKNLLEDIKKSDEHLNNILLNKDGYYLIGLDSNKEFGFMFHKGENRFSDDYKTAWNQILQGEKSVLEFDNKYAHYLTYDPVSVISPKRSIASDRKWYLIAYHTYEGMCDELCNIFKLNLIFLIPLVLIEVFISFILTRLKIRDMKAQESISEHQDKIENLVDEQRDLLSLFDIGDSTLFKWCNDEEWSVAYVSKNIEQMLGYTQKDFFTKRVTYLDCIYKDDYNRVAQEVESAEQKKLDFFTHEPYRIVTKSGEVKWVVDYTVVKKDEQGNIEYFIGYISDITQMVDAQQEMQHKLQDVIDTQNSIVILTDSKELKFANKTFLEFFGYEKMEDFLKKYNCICDRFIEQDSFFHLGKVKEDEENWIESLLNLSGRQRVVSMLNYSVEPHAFAVSINNFGENEYIVNFIDITDSMVEKLELKKEANIDELTQLYNRIYFNKNIENILQVNKKHEFKTGIIFFDIDHFKNVNDTYGHDAGDEVLQTVAMLVKKHTRMDDKVIRWGGEEFIVISAVEHEESLAQIAEHLRVVIEEYNFNKVGSVTCSFGCQMYDEGKDILETIKKADEKLYFAKENGRNKVVL